LARDLLIANDMGALPTGVVEAATLNLTDGIGPAAAEVEQTTARPDAAPEPVEIAATPSQLSVPAAGEPTGMSSAPAEDALRLDLLGEMDPLVAPYAMALLPG
jgi:hypothetical protein